MKINKIIFIMFVFIVILFGMSCTSFAEIEIEVEKKYWVINKDVYIAMPESIVYSSEGMDIGTIYGKEAFDDPNLLSKMTYRVYRDDNNKLAMQKVPEGTIVTVKGEKWVKYVELAEGDSGLSYDSGFLGFSAWADRNLQWSGGWTHIAYCEVDDRINTSEYSKYAEEFRKKGSILYIEEEKVPQLGAEGTIWVDALRPYNENDIWANMAFRYTKDPDNFNITNEEKKWLEDIDKFKDDDLYKTYINKYGDINTFNVIHDRVFGTNHAVESINDTSTEELKSMIDSGILSNWTDEEIDTALERVQEDPNLTEEEKEAYTLKLKERSIFANITKTIYRSPNQTDQHRQESNDLDGIIEGADSFLNQPSTSSNEQKINFGEINPEALQSFSSTMYNILLVVGIVVAVLMGGVLGIKFMLASVEGKAEIKEWLVKYAVGCAIVFGAFGIWKIIVTILEQIT